MFASNFPVDKVNGSFSDLISALNAILEPFSEEDKRKFFASNAKKFYRLWQYVSASYENTCAELTLLDKFCMFADTDVL